MPTARLGVSARVRLPVVTEQVRQTVDAMLQKASLDIEAHAKAAAPVDTGFLKSSIKMEPVETLHYRVTAYAHYAIYQEFGTRFMPAHPFMRPAVELVRAELDTALRMVVA